MAYSFSIATSESISFEEFNNYLEEKINPEAPETIIECTEVFQKLSNNNEFLIDFIHNDLNNLDSFQENNYHSSQSLMLYRGKHYYIRLNIWPPLSEREDIREWQNDLYFYLRAHDHNFNFLTVGYFGEGYATELWEYESDSVSGIVGEKVEMIKLETTKLPKGKAMFYRASKDIHCQLPSDDYSLSLNIMPISLNVLRKEQFYFNLEKKEISGIAANGGTGRYLVTNLAGIYGNNETIEILERMAFKHKIPFLRLKCFDALSKLTGEENIVWRKALLDDSRIVVDNARLLLSKEGGGNVPMQKKYYTGFNASKL